MRKPPAPRCNRYRLTGLVATATLALVAAAVAAPAVASSSAAARARTAAPHARASFRANLGAARLVGASRPSAAALRVEKRGNAAAIHRQIRVLRPAGKPHRLRAAAASPRRPARAVGRRDAHLLKAFPGISAIQNGRVAGFDLEPPDEGLGANSRWVVNFVNVVGRVYRPSGAAATPVFYLNTFFKEPADTNTSDPRVYFDPDSHRWFATMVEYQFNDDFTAITESHVDLAVSRTSSPKGSWNVYQIPTSNPQHADCPCLADYPMLGVDRANVYVTTSEYNSALNDYHGAQLYVISKKELARGWNRPRMAIFENLSAGGSLAGHVQPANTYGKSSAEFMMSSDDPDGTSGDDLAVWAVTRIWSLTGGHGAPRLSVRMVDSEKYTFPPNAVTPPGFCSGSYCGDGEHTTGVMATDFDEMMETQYINGLLVGAVHTGITPAGDSTERSGIAWFVVSPKVRHGKIAWGTKVVRQGYLGAKGKYLLYPHINMTQDGSMAMVFSIGGPDTFLSSAYAVAPPGGTFGRINVVAAGQRPFNGFGATPTYGGIGRWGDYSNGEIIPGTNRVWLATQFIPKFGDGNENWGNSVFELQLP